MEAIQSDRAPFRGTLSNNALCLQNKRAEYVRRMCDLGASALHRATENYIQRQYVALNN